MPLREFLRRVVEHQSLSSFDAEKAMLEILAGNASTPQIAAFLTALRMKGETPDEILGFARAMRAKVTPVNGGDATQLLDTCGTGGDGGHTFNISTATAFVVAGCGVRVAKHGNRSVTSRCGSADILEELGVKIDVSPEQMGASIREIGIGFLFAPALHPAMKFAMPARNELGFRTAFNLLGPLANPANAAFQLTGAPSLQAAELMALTLARLGLRRGYVVHGSDGMDEVTTTGPTHVWRVEDGVAEPFTVTPEDFGVSRARPEQLCGGDRCENAAVVRAVLAGAPGPHRNIVLVNAAMALLAAGRALNYPDAMSRAVESIDRGVALGMVDRLVQFSNEAGMSFSAS
jgi:anthranilate phosphoribosyltransferase